MSEEVSTAVGGDCVLTLFPGLGDTGVSLWTGNPFKTGETASLDGLWGGGPVGFGMAWMNFSFQPNPAVS